MDQTSVFADVKGEIRDKGTVREKGNKEDGVRDDSKSGDPVYMMLVEVPTYLGAGDERRRWRNERFGRWGGNTKRRRRSIRQRRVTLSWR
jgi:hypothetical protein